MEYILSEKEYKKLKNTNNKKYIKKLEDELNEWKNCFLSSSVEFRVNKLSTLEPKYEIILRLPLENIPKELEARL